MSANRTPDPKSKGAALAAALVGIIAAGAIATGAMTVTVPTAHAATAIERGTQSPPPPHGR